MSLWRRYLLQWKSRLSSRARSRYGLLERLEAVKSPELGNQRDVLVYLPASYHGGDRRYPVVYMHDGQNLFDPVTSFAGDWDLGEHLAAAARRSAEAIVVAVPNMGEKRIDEYSPFTDPEQGGGRGQLYLEFLTATLKPLVDGRYRTLTGRAHTGIAGSSMGGLISLYAFFHYQRWFGFAGVMSPSLWFGEAAIFPAVESAPFVPGKIYLDIGTLEGSDTVTGVRRLRDLLTAKGYRRGHDLEYVEESGGHHHEAAWGRRFRRALPFLLTP